MLNISIDLKDRLFYDQYEYVLNFKMPEMSTLRGLDHATIDRTITHRNTWKQRNPNFGGSWRGRKQQITDNERANCHSLCDFLLSQQNYKMVISTDWAYIYSNDLNMLRKMESLPYVLPLSLKQARIDRPRDTLLIRNSQHEHRSYFRAGRLTPEQRVNLKNFLENQTDIRIGPGLKHFLSDEHAYHYLNDNVFIDHNGSGIVMMLNLIIPRIVRKTVKLIRDK